MDLQGETRSDQMVVELITCEESAQDQLQTNDRHSTNNQKKMTMQFCAPFAAGTICKEKRGVRVLEQRWLLTKWSANACLRGLQRIIHPELSPDTTPNQRTTDDMDMCDLQGKKRSQRGLMMVVTNEMADKCLFARNLPAIKSMQKWPTLNQCQTAWT
jgi:hypothetical protein